MPGSSKNKDGVSRRADCEGVMGAVTLGVRYQRALIRGRALRGCRRRTPLRNRSRRRVRFSGLFAVEPPSLTQDNRGMSGITLEEIKRLSITARLELLEKIWDSLHDTPEAVPLSDAQRREVDRRLKDLEQDPDSVESWDTVKRDVCDRKSSE